jgi:hypothetical protein
MSLRPPGRGVDLSGADEDDSSRFAVGKSEVSRVHEFPEARRDELGEPLSAPILQLFRGVVDGCPIFVSALGTMPRAELDRYQRSAV